MIGMLLFGIAAYAAGEHRLLSPSSLAAANDCQTFSQTGKTICGDFLKYWQDHGGLAQQGYPISDVFDEKSETDGITHKVQYFERAVFEAHPENQPPNNVLLSLLGSQKFKTKYSGNQPSTSTSAPSTAPPTATIPAAQVPGTELIGQTVTFKGSFDAGTLQGTVTDAKRGVSLPGVSASGVFLVLTMSVTNIGNAAADVGAFGFVVIDSKGRQFSFPDNSDIQFAAQKQYNLKGRYSSIQPSLSADLVFAFDIAADATGLKLAVAK